jgi:hypothetical protein
MGEKTLDSSFLRFLPLSARIYPRPKSRHPVLPGKFESNI